MTRPRHLLRAASASTGFPQAPRGLRGLPPRPRCPGAARGCRQRAPSAAARTPQGPLLSPPRPRPRRSRRRKWEVPRARAGARPLPQARPPPPPLSARSGASLPSPPPLHHRLCSPGARRGRCVRGAARGPGRRAEGARRGAGRGRRGRGREPGLGVGRRGGGGGAGGWRPVSTEGQGRRCGWPVLAAVSWEEWRRPPGAASPHCPLLRCRLAGDRHRLAGFPWVSWTLRPDVRPPTLSRFGL